MAGGPRDQEPGAAALLEPKEEPGAEAPNADGAPAEKGAVGFGLKASSSAASIGPPAADDPDLPPPLASIFSHPKATSLPVPLYGMSARLLGSILNFRPHLPTKAKDLSYYFLSLYMTHGTYVPADAVALVTACYWLAAKSCDTGFRLALLLADPKFCGAVEKFRGEDAAKAFGLEPPSRDDWEREYGRDLPDSEAKPFVVIDGVVYKQER